MHFLWTIIIGFVAGVIARFFHPGNKYEPKGFILTVVLGIVGAFVVTYLGHAVGWYQADESAGFIGAIVGAIIVLVSSRLVLSGRKGGSVISPPDAACYCAPHVHFSFGAGPVGRRLIAE